METKISITVGTSVTEKLFMVYGLKDITGHAKKKHKSLLEICSMYPNRGCGFEARHKNWKPEDYFLISQAELTSNRTGEVFGTLFRNNKQVWQTPRLLEDAPRRGFWRVSPGNSTATLDNGMEYSLRDIAPEMEKRYRFHSK